MKLFTYTNMKLKPEESIGLHEQSSWELTYIVTGSGTRLVGEESHSFESGELMLIPPHVPHCWSFDKVQTDENGCIANISTCFDSTLLHAVAQSFPVLSERIEALERESCSRLFSRKQTNAIAQVMKRMDKETEIERTASIFRLLVLITDDQSVYQKFNHRKTTAIQSRIEQINGYISNNIQRDIRLEHLVKYIGMSRSALCLFIKDNLGVTFTEHLNSIRIEQACELLKKRGTPIKEIGYAIGYNSTSYFIRTFIKLKGCSYVSEIWHEANLEIN